MTVDMIECSTGTITTAQAVKLFKEFALKTGYLHKDELTEHAEYFSDAMKEHAEALKEDAIGEVPFIKGLLSQLKAQRKEMSDKEAIEEINEQIIDAQADLATAVDDAKEAAKLLADFKADKTQFLIGYMNEQTQGN